MAARFGILYFNLVQDDPSDNLGTPKNILPQGRTIAFAGWNQQP
jgi:hypothetical protein